MSPLNYNLGNPNGPKFNLFGYALLALGILLIALSYYALSAGIVGAIAASLGGVVVTSKDGVLIDLNKNQLLVYTSFYGYKYGKWENLRNYGSVSILISHRIWKTKHLSPRYNDVSPREFLVCLLGKSHHRKQNLGRFDSRQKAQEFLTQVSLALKLPIERYQPQN